MAITTQNSVKLLTINEASQVLHIHENTLRRWCNRGVISSFRIGTRGDRRILESNVNELLSNMQNNHGNFDS